MKIKSIKKSKAKKPTDGYILGTNYQAIDSVLEQTRGTMPFQENLMQVFASVCNVPFGSADSLRRIISKKIEEGTHDPKHEKMLLETREQWYEGCTNNSIPRNIADEWWAKLMAGAGYGFNIAHACAYSILTYKTLWYRYNFPAEFIAARLNTNPEEKDFWLVEAVKIGVEIIPPHVNVSTDKYVAKDGKLYLRLNSIDRLGDTASKAIIDNRPYTTLSEFREKLSAREVNSTLAHALFMMDSLSGLTGEYSDLNTGREITNLSSSIKVTETKGKKREWIYNSKLDLFVDFMGGTILFNNTLAKKIRELSDEGYKLGLVKKIENGYTQSGKEKFEIYLSDGKFPDLYIGKWQAGDVYSTLGKTLKENMFIAYKTNQEYGKFLLVKNNTAYIQDLTDWVG